MIRQKWLKLVEIALGACKAVEIEPFKLPVGSEGVLTRASLAVSSSTASRLTWHARSNGSGVSRGSQGEGRDRLKLGGLIEQGLAPRSRLAAAPSPALVSLGGNPYLLG
jgi:hypothetical protein